MIRNSAKAIIIDDNCVLLTKNEDRDGYFYLFPGGGQEHGETLQQTLIRECREEVGKKVDVRELLHLREYIGKHHEFASFDGDVHQIEFYFACSIIGDEVKPSNPDSHQVGMEWIHKDQLPSIRLYPKALVAQVLQTDEAVIYLGDVN
ncbi:NUDIX domain-containing protein [Geomicrobium sp. JCM 19038]|uniref:NUDIX domain-containing protein n=1 Tax=Geomicrobium sp. JCM 19038 TaxID=1460635 RepID=UPI00045F4650|nr:NUDIX domain-containing protein [Geomicrobium sp. JCM 19038]GAK09468.1 MutT/Nudix family protein [Geomicrobium sp. JCM 19038]